MVSKHLRVLVMKSFSKNGNSFFMFVRVGGFVCIGIRRDLHVLCFLDVLTFGFVLEIGCLGVCC